MMLLISNDGSVDLSWKLGSTAANPIPPLPYRVCFHCFVNINISVNQPAVKSSVEEDLLVMSTLSCSQYTFEPFCHLVVVALYTSDPFCHLVMVALLILTTQDVVRTLFTLP